MRKVIRVVVAVLVIIILFGLLCRTKSNKRATTYAEYVKQYGETDLPKSAKNICQFTSGVGLGGRAWVCRFEAPLDDCKAYALTVYSYYDFGDDTPAPPLEFTTSVAAQYDSAPHKPDNAMRWAYGARDLSWFDVENISNFITLPRDHTHRPFIWIDTDKEILYSYWTD